MADDNSLDLPSADPPETLVAEDTARPQPRRKTNEARADGAEVEPGDTLVSREAFETVQRERDEHFDRLLRIAAEFENYRKRIDRERRELSEVVTADILSDLLPIVDDLERALAAESGSADAYRRGVELIYKKVIDLLRGRGVTPIEAVGKDFDPHVHQAVVQELSPEHREGEVMAELQRGYRIGDRLLRPAMVKVAKA